jgi:6-phosphogluconolactonase (cycloisomerase 2 family)
MATTKIEAGCRGARWARPMMLFGVVAMLDVVSGCKTPLATVRYHDLGACNSLGTLGPQEAFQLVGFDEIKNHSQVPATFDPQYVVLQTSPPSPLLKPMSAEAQALFGSLTQLSTLSATPGQTKFFPTGSLAAAKFQVQNTDADGLVEANSYSRFLLYQNPSSDSQSSPAAQILLVKDNSSRVQWPSWGCSEIDLQTTTYVYVATNDATGGGGSILVYAVNGADGALSSAGALKRVTPDSATSIVADPSMAQVYVTTTKGMEIYARDAKDGMLHDGHALINGNLLGPGITSLVVEPSGHYLEVAMAGSIYMLYSDAGADLVLGTSVPLPFGSWFLAADPAGRFIYAVNDAADAGQVAAYQMAPVFLTDKSHPLGFFNPAGGDLTPYAAPVSTFTFPKTRIAATASFSYVNATPAVLGYHVDLTKKTFSMVANSAIPSSEAQAIAVDPAGAYVYAATADQFRTYLVDVSSGALTDGPWRAAPPATDRSISTDPFGRVVLSLNRTATTATLTSYLIESDTGALTAAGNAALGNVGAVAMAVGGTIR